jgi:hypothetical protein
MKNAKTKFTPVLRRGRENAVKPLKKQRRGRPFEPGNTAGVATRFAKGMPSANPGGRPKSAEIGRASRALLAAKYPENPFGEDLTWAERFVWKLARRGDKKGEGGIVAIRELADRAEGRPRASGEMNHGPDPIAELIACMREESERTGLPEGMSEQEPPIQ